MGYTTEFDGHLTPETPFPKEITEYINAFSRARHVKRNVKKILENLKSSKEDYPYPVIDNFGLEGEFFIPTPAYQEEFQAKEHRFARDMTDDVIDYNGAPGSCPGYWCHWVIKDGVLVWNGAEKFYSYIKWLQYMIVHFFAPNNITLNGEIRWSGENVSDVGVISVKKNRISVKKGFEGGVL